MSEYITVKEASEMINGSPRSIRAKIKANRIDCYFDGWRWYVRREDFFNGSIGVDHRTLWSRNYKVDGSEVFNREEGKVSVIEASKIIGLTLQQVYHAIRMGYLSAKKRRALWVVDLDEAKKYAEKKIGKQFKPQIKRKKRSLGKEKS